MLAGGVAFSRLLLGIIKRQGRQLARQHDELGRRDATEQRLRRRLSVAAERGRRGTALQDGALQALYAVILDLELAADDLGRDLDGARGRIDRSIDRLSGVMKDIRASIPGLAPLGRRAAAPTGTLTVETLIEGGAARTPGLPVITGKRGGAEVRHV